MSPMHTMRPAAAARACTTGGRELPAQRCDSIHWAGTITHLSASAVVIPNIRGWLSAAPHIPRGVSLAAAISALVCSSARPACISSGLCILRLGLLVGSLAGSLVVLTRGTKTGSCGRDATTPGLAGLRDAQRPTTASIWKACCIQRDNG